METCSHMAHAGLLYHQYLTIYHTKMVILSGDYQPFMSLSTLY